MLAVLRLARGAIVSRATLTQAMYPPSLRRPASAPFACDVVARMLRLDGHRIDAVRGQGYRLVAETPRSAVA